MPVIPATTKYKWELVIESHLSKKRDSISKITRAKTSRSMAQVVQHLPSRCEALNSNLTITTKNKTKKTM
jgi:hypothetical protein